MREAELEEDGCGLNTGSTLIAAYNLQMKKHNEKNWTTIKYKEDQTINNRSNKNLRIDNDDIKMMDSFCLLRSTINNKGTNRSVFGRIPTKILVNTLVLATTAEFFRIARKRNNRS